METPRRAFIDTITPIVVSLRLIPEVRDRVIAATNQQSRV